MLRLLKLLLLTTLLLPLLTGTLAVVLLNQGRTTPAEIAAAAVRGGVWSGMRPYLETLTADA